MKKYLCLSVLPLLAASTVSFAHANYKGERFEVAPVVACAEKCLHDGFYAGVGLGYDSYRIREQNLFSTPGSSLSIINRTSAKGWNGSLFAGYGQYYDWFYLAGEVMLNTSSATGSHGVSIIVEDASAGFSSKVNVDTTYSGAILPGIKVSPSTLIYGRVGWSRTDFKTNEQVNVEGVTFGVSDSEWKNGLTLGVGVETVLCEKVSVRGEYNYTNYASFKTKTPFNTQIAPSNSQFVVGVIYHFA